MSDILRRIVTVFEARAGNVHAVLGQAAQGWRSYGQGARQAANDQTYLNRQLMAFQTTWRYAIAGAGVYGAFSAVTRLSELQTQLGLISAFGDVSTPQGRGFLLVGQNLSNLGSQLRDVAVETIQPLNSVYGGVTNLLSTIQNVPEDQISPIIASISKSATLSMTPVEDATRAYAGLAQIFGQPLNIHTFEKLGGEFTKLLSLVPGGPPAGKEIINQLAPLASIFAIGGGTPEQMFGLLTTALRAGGTPSTTARGIQFLAQSIEQPKGKYEKALSAIGITPEFVSQHGVTASILRLIDEFQKAGGAKGNPKQAATALDEEALAQLEQNYGAGALATSGIRTSPQAAQLLKSTIPRIHGIRALLLLALQRKNIAPDLEAFNQYISNYGEAIKFNKLMWGRFQNRAVLPKAAVALQAMQQDIASVFEPVINYAAKGVTQFRTHVTGGSHGREAILGGLGLLGLLRYRGRLGSLVGLGGKGFVGAKTAENLITGEVPTGTANNPLYVIVMGQVFGPGGVFSRRPPVGTIPGGIGGKNAPAREPGGRTGPSGAPMVFGRGLLGKLGIAGIVAVTADQILSQAFPGFWDKHNQWNNTETFPLTHRAIKAITYLAQKDPVPAFIAQHRGGALRFGVPGITGQTDTVTKKHIDDMTKAVVETNRYTKTEGDKRTKEIQLQQRTGLVPGMGTFTIPAVQGKVDLHVNIKHEKPDGKVDRQTVHVPVNIFPQTFAPKAPQSRGRDVTLRGG